ncbi:MAG: hypothetical protein ACO1N8_00530 [Methylophilus sp.]
MLCFPAMADNRLANTQAEVLPAENDETGLEQTLERNFSPEDRARLRKALADYAKNTDPEHNQIEQKRQAMKDSIAQRFSECDLDNDESLDRKEATLCLPQVARHFSFVDVDQDNLITLEELELAQAKSIERRKATEARIEAQRIQATEEEIKNKSKSKAISDSKQASNTRKRPI